MKQSIYVLFIILTFSKQGMACVCGDMDQSQIRETLSTSDVAFIGEVLGSDHWDPYVLDYWNRREEGNDVVIRVDPVIKGNIMKKDLIYIYQSAGSCTESFKYGSKQLIFGDEITKIRRPEKKKISNFDIPLPPPGPNEIGLQKGGVYLTNADDEIIDFLKDRIKTRKVIDTDMCRSFLQDSELYEEVISFIKN